MLSQDILVDEKHHCCQTHCYCYRQSPCNKDCCSIRDCHVVVLKLPQQLEKKLHRSHSVNLGNIRWLSKCLAQTQRYAGCGKAEENGLGSCARDDDKAEDSETVAYSVQMTAVGVDSDSEYKAEDLFNQFSNEDVIRSPLAKKKMVPESFDISDAAHGGSKCNYRQKLKNNCKETVQRTDKSDGIDCQKSANSTISDSNKLFNVPKENDHCDKQCFLTSNDMEHSQKYGSDQVNIKNSDCGSEFLMSNLSAEISQPCKCNENGEAEHNESNISRGVSEISATARNTIGSKSDLSNGSLPIVADSVTDPVENNSTKNLSKITSNIVDTQVNSNKCTDNISELTVELDTNQASKSVAEVTCTNTKIQINSQVDSECDDFFSGSCVSSSETKVPTFNKTDDTNVIETLSGAKNMVPNEFNSKYREVLSTSSDSTVVQSYGSASDAKDILSQVMDEVFFGDESDEENENPLAINEDEIWLDKPNLLQKVSFEEEPEVDVSKTDNKNYPNSSPKCERSDYASLVNGVTVSNNQETSFFSDNIEEDISKVVDDLVNKVVESCDNWYLSSAYLEQETASNDGDALTEIQNVGSTESDFLSMKLSDCETKEESCYSSDGEKNSLCLTDSDVDEHEPVADKEVSEFISSSPEKTDSNSNLTDVLAEDILLPSNDAYVAASHKETVPKEVANKCLSHSDTPVDLTTNGVLNRICCDEINDAANVDVTVPEAIDLSLKHTQREISEVVQEAPSVEEVKEQNSDYAYTNVNKCPLNLVCDKTVSTSSEKDPDSKKSEINNNVIVNEKLVQQENQETETILKDSALHTPLNAKQDVYDFSETNEEVKDFRHVLPRVSSSEENDSAHNRIQEADQSSSTQCKGNRHLWGNLRQHIKEDWLKRKLPSKIPKCDDSPSSTHVSESDKKHDDKSILRDSGKTMYSIVNDSELTRHSDNRCKESEGKVPKLLIAKSMCGLPNSGEQFVSKVVSDDRQNGKVNTEKYPLKLSLKLIPKKRKLSKEYTSEKSSPEKSDCKKELVARNSETDNNNDEAENSNQTNKDNQSFNGINSDMKKITASSSSSSSPMQESQWKLEVPKLVPISTSRSPSPSLLCYARIDEDNVIKSVNLEENEVEPSPVESDELNKKIIENQEAVKKVTGVTQLKNGRRSGSLKPISHEILEKMADKLGKEFDFDDEDVESFKESAKNILTVVEAVRRKKRKKSQKNSIDKKKTKTNREMESKDSDVITPIAEDFRIPEDEEEDNSKKDTCCDTAHILYKEDERDEPILSSSIGSGDTEIDLSEDCDYVPNHSERLKNALRSKRRKKDNTDLEGMLTRMRSLRNRGGDEVISVDFDNPIPLEYASRWRKRRLKEKTAAAVELSPKTSKWSEGVQRKKAFPSKESSELPQINEDGQGYVLSTDDEIPLTIHPKAKKDVTRVKPRKWRKVQGIRKYKYKPSKIKEGPQATTSISKANIMKKRFFKSRQTLLSNDDEDDPHEDTIHSTDHLVDLSLFRNKSETESGKEEGEICNVQPSDEYKNCDIDTETASECDAHPCCETEDQVDSQTEFPLDLSKKQNSDSHPGSSTELQEEKMGDDDDDDAWNPDNNGNDDCMRDESSPLPPVPSGIMSEKSDICAVEQMDVDGTKEDECPEPKETADEAEAPVEITVPDTNEENSCDLPKITSVVSLANSGSLNEISESSQNSEEPVAREPEAPLSAFLPVTQSSFTATTQSTGGQTVPAFHTKIIPSKSPLSGGLMLSTLPTDSLPTSPVTQTSSLPPGKDIYNAQYERLKSELMALEMVALQKEKERNNILKLKQYKQSVMRKLQLKKALLQHQQKQQNSPLSPDLISTTEYQRHLPISPIARHAPIVMMPPNGPMGPLLNPLTLNQKSSITSPVAAAAQPTIFIAPPVMPVASQATQQAPQESGVSSTRDTPKTPISVSDSDTNIQCPSSSATVATGKPSSMSNPMSSSMQPASEVPNSSSTSAFVLPQDWDKRLKIVPRNDFNSGLSSVATIVAKASENFGLQLQGWMEDSQGMLHPLYQRTAFTNPANRPIAPKMMPDNRSPTNTLPSGSPSYFINPLTSRMSERRPVRNLDDVIRNVYSRKLSSPTVTSSLPPYLAQSSLYGSSLIGLPIGSKPSDLTQKGEGSPRQQQQQLLLLQQQQVKLPSTGSESSRLSGLSSPKLPKFTHVSSPMNSSTTVPLNSTLAKLLLSPLPDSHPASKAAGNSTETSSSELRKNEAIPEFKEPLSNPFDTKSPEKHRWPYCRTCHSQYARFICAGCNNQWYCSEPCQVKDWKHHFKSCRR